MAGIGLTGPLGNRPLAAYCMACRLPLSLRRAGSSSCHRAICSIIFGKPDIVLASDNAPVEERHRSLTLIMDSSWRWLSPRERTVLSALAVW